MRSVPVRRKRRKAAKRARYNRAEDRRVEKFLLSHGEYKSVKFLREVTSSRGEHIAKMIEEWHKQEWHKHEMRHLP